MRYLQSRLLNLSIQWAMVKLLIFFLNRSFLDIVIVIVFIFKHKIQNNNDSREKSKTGFSKLNSPSRFCI